MGLRKEKGDGNVTNYEEDYEKEDSHNVIMFVQLLSQE